MDAEAAKLHAKQAYKLSSDDRYANWVEFLGKRFGASMAV